MRVLVLAPSTCFGEVTVIWYLELEFGQRDGDGEQGEEGSDDCGENVSQVKLGGGRAASLWVVLLRCF